MEIIWSPQSLDDIEFIGDFIAQNNPLRAISFVDELVASVQRLKEYPESGSLVDENPVCRQIIHNGYRLVYQLRVGKVIIITILGPGQIFRK